MSEGSESEEDYSHDPVMLVVTDLLKPAPLKIARITRNFTLPRLVPVMTLVFVGVGMLVGLIFAALASMVVGLSLTQFLLFTTVGGGAGWLLNTARIDDQEVWKYAAFVLAANMKSRTRLNSSPTRMVSISSDTPPPDGGILVASNRSTAVYAVPGRSIAGAGRVYAGIAPMTDLMLGEITILESTVRVKESGFS